MSGEAAGYDPRRYWNARANPNSGGGAVQPWLLERIAAHVAGQERVLELGPGIGRTFGSYAPGQAVVTVDLSRRYAAALEACARERGIVLAQHFLETPQDPLPFGDGAFAAGVCVQVLMHVPPDAIAHTMGELVRVCGRTLVVAGVNPAWAAGGAAHCFAHDYLRICDAIGARADAAFIRSDKVCLVLRAARADG